jgi:ribosomal protein L32
MSDPKKMSKAEKEAKRKKAFEWLLQGDDLPACEFCGRVVLAGWCCTKALEKARKTR